MSIRWLSLLTGALLGALLLLAGSPARAQCGAICLYEIGTPDSTRSAAGAGARAEDAAIAVWNPAGMTQLEGTHVHVGTTLGIVDTGFDVGNGTTATGNDGGDLNDFLPLAGTYASFNPWDELRVGFTFSALYGGDVNYDNNWVGRSFVTEAELSALNLSLQFAYPITEWFSLGGGINFTYAFLNVQFRAGTASGAPTVEIDSADDWAPAGNVGLFFTPGENTRIGIHYRTPTNFDLDGSFDIPAGFSNNFDGEMNFPQGVNVAVFHRLNESIDLFGDAGWSEWSDFGFLPVTIGATTIPIDRNWNDTWRIAAGVRWRARENLALSTGISYDSSPVPDGRRLPDIPVGEQLRFSLGGDVAVAKNIAVGLGYTLNYSPEMGLDNIPLPPVGAPILDGDYDPTYIHFVTINVSFHFGGPDS